MSQFVLDPDNSASTQYFNFNTVEIDTSLINKSHDSSEDNAVSWTNVLTHAFRDPLKLLEFLELGVEENLDQIKLDSNFTMLVPRSYAERMRKGDWHDPLLRQILPLKKEQVETKGFVNDPVGDLQAEISPGVLHKYHGRILLVTTGACPVHCRYCFRREFPYVDSIPDKKHWAHTLTKIRTDKNIKEVILSGGDPLMLSDYRLKKMCKEIAKIPHITSLRFHTRVPIFLPERITNQFLKWFGELQVNKVIVIHSNHQNEINDEVGNVLLALRNKGVTLLNQTVLLKGVNDSSEILAPLMERLFEYQVLPYYLHQLDKVKGSAHFEVKREKSIAIIEELKEQLPGYLVPRLVEELSGKRSKQSIVKNDK